jgi:hypothetical protein
VKRVASSVEKALRSRDAWVRAFGFLLLTGLFIGLLALLPQSTEPPAFAGASYGPLAADDTVPTDVTTDTTELAPSTTEPASTATEATSTTGYSPPTTEAPISTVDVDVVVYATQTSGLAAVRELALGAPNLRIALISCGNLLETPLAQGLSVEDARDIDGVTGGFYSEWRETVQRYYALLGRTAFTSSGRFVYEPEVAATVLWSYVTGPKAPNVLFYSAKLLAASDADGDRHVDIQVEGGTLTRLNTRYFIDASVEGDLARMLGADYRIGRDEEVYNDVAGNEPAYPSADNNYVTAPQRFSALLTLKVYSSGSAPRIANLVHPNYDPSSYAGTTLASKNVSSFGSSWTMKIAVLPNGKRELNETWSDWPDIGLAFQWVFDPDKRGDIRKRVLEWTINRVRYLQEHGYPNVGIATIPQKLYIREGPRIVGNDTYTVDDLRDGAARDTVAMGCYVEYDRHDAFYPTHIATTRYVHMPMQALIAKGHPYLLVSTAVSADYQAYSSAVRMEPTRANMGAAAAMIIIAANQQGVDPSQVSYDLVRSLLSSRGYQLQ